MWRNLHKKLWECVHFLCIIQFDHLVSSEDCTFVTSDGNKFNYPTTYQEEILLLLDWLHTMHWIFWSFIRKQSNNMWISEMRSPNLTKRWREASQIPAPSTPSVFMIINHQPVIADHPFRFLPSEHDRCSDCWHCSRAKHFLPLSGTAVQCGKLGFALQLHFH